MESVDTLLPLLRQGGASRTEAREALLVLARGPDAGQIREYLETVKRREVLEVQWELEEILEALAPPTAPATAPEPEPEPEPEAPDDTVPSNPGEAIQASDLTLLYDDPRGLMLHRHKDGKRWFATQVDPRTGVPQTTELYPHEIPQVKAQLDGSPYWVLGA
ncbi:MAG: hypothetical protein QGG40_00910 [Myxococcota bacterium]|jgi:hypothetical protein|nr:hypothetical protein [Myxococcota bacterium]